MALVSLGKNAALIEQLARPLPDLDVPIPQTEHGLLSANEVQAVVQQVAAVQQAANDSIKKTRGDIQKSLTPWIPGDFLVTYGTLLAAWDALRNDFLWMVILSIIIGVVFVWGGAFSMDGFRQFSRKLAGKLTGRTLVGIVVSLIAAATVPTSGWYQLKLFQDHETSVLTTLGVLVGVLVLVLTGLKMRGIIDTNAE